MVTQSMHRLEMRMQRRTSPGFYPNNGRRTSERGSLALEQVLFIGAIVAMSVGLYSFYEDLSKYFKDFEPATAPTGVGGSAQSSQG